MPGVPLAVALPDRELTLLDATERKCAFLREATAALPNVRVVCGRAEEQELEATASRSQGPRPSRGGGGVVLAARGVGGAAVVYAGTSRASSTASRRNSAPQRPERHAVEGCRDRSLLVFRKVAPTPDGFPRRVGVARKRPLE